MLRIDIPKRNYLLYLVLPHPVKIALLTPASRTMLDRVNREANEQSFSGEAATQYDARHRYDEAEQHDYPARHLIERWGQTPFGRALDVGAGSGYFTTIIARRAESVVAVEPVKDLQEVLRRRCATERIDNIDVVGESAADALAGMPISSFDSAFVIQSLHHFHRRPEVLAALGRVVRPGGRLFLVEPHHNLRRAVRLFRAYMRTYRSPSFWTNALNWSTHDFLTRREIGNLCRHGGFADIRLSTYWVPFARRIVPDSRRRFLVERSIGHVPGVRHFAAILAAEARRTDRAIS